MANRNVEEYAHRRGLSNRQAKKRMRQSAKAKPTEAMPVRGVVVAGTGRSARRPKVK